MNSSTTGTLFLIPSALSDNQSSLFVMPVVRDQLQCIQFYLSENVRTARRYLKELNLSLPIDQLHFEELNKHTSHPQLLTRMKPLHEGMDMGLLSEAGCPCIADPGSMAVAYAHAHHIRVVPLQGLSSVFMSLMASGLNGQQFAFHGYLPIKAKEFKRVLNELEEESARKDQTQLFIETPFRNNTLLHLLLTHLAPSTKLCISHDLTGKNEYIRTLPVEAWKKISPTLAKRPTVFLFQATEFYGRLKSKIIRSSVSISKRKENVKHKSRYKSRG